MLSPTPLDGAYCNALLTACPLVKNQTTSFLFSSFSQV